MISKGKLPPAPDAVAAATHGGIIQFTWTDNAGTGTSKNNDKAVLVAFFPATNEVIFSIGAGTRESGNAVLDTANRKGDVAETWMGFLSHEEADAACSVYMGSVVLYVWATDDTGKTFLLLTSTQTPDIINGHEKL